MNIKIDNKYIPTGISALDKYYYRYDNYSYDTYGISVVCYQYPVIKETLKGVWLDIFGSRKFVLTKAKKHWACFTQEEALLSFIKRKECQASILRGQLEIVKIILEKVNV